MSFETSQTLLLRVRDSSDDAAWSEFVRLYSPLLHRFCVARGLQDADAADVIQDVMRSVFQALRKFEYDREKGTFRSWLYTVTRNKLNNFFTRKGRQPISTSDPLVLGTPHDDEDPIEAEWNAQYRRRMFRWAAERVEPAVTPQTWQAFWKTAVEEKTGAEVSTELGISVGAVYVAKSRVIARLREEILSVTGEGDFDGPLGK